MRQKLPNTFLKGKDSRKHNDADYASMLANK